MTLASSQTDERTASRRRGPRPPTDYSVVLQSVQSEGLLRRRYGYYVVKIGLIFLALGGLWVGFAFLGDHWAQVGLAAAMGLVFTQIMFVSHEAAHRQIFRSQHANEMAAMVMGTLFGGVSLAWWHNKHNKHHAAPNQISKDPDIDPSIVHFYPLPTKPKNRIWRWMHERQGWWFFPLLVVEALNLHAQSIQALVTRPQVKRRWIELSMMVVRLGLYPAVLYVFLPAGLATVFLATQLAVTGVYLGSVFAASHIGMPIVDKTARIDFLRRQVLTSRNVAGGRFTSFMMGDLNLQIEHHLFPSASGPSLRPIQAILRPYCDFNGIHYEEVSIWQAWATVARYLNKVGLAAGAPFKCPVLAELRPA